MNQQINQMVNSDAFKKIFKDLEEKSKDSKANGKIEMRDFIDLETALNQVSNTASVTLVNEQADFNG